MGGWVDGWGAGEVGGGSAAERRRGRDGAGRKTGEEGEGVSPVKAKGEERRECLLGGNKRTVRKANKGLGGGHRHRNVFINTRGKASVNTQRKIKQNHRPPPNDLI